MRRRFARRLNAVVATDTITEDIYVCEIRRYPGGCHMAVVASVVACDMRRMLASCSHSIVAANTIADDIAMVEKCRQPG